MERVPLFRPDAVAAFRDGEHGRIVLAMPLALHVLAAFFASLALVLAAFSYFGTYTTHRTLRGRLVTQRASLDVRSPQAGIVLEMRVQEGQRVARGDVLFVVSSERTSRGGVATQESVGEQLARRRQSLVAQAANTRVLASAERRSLAEGASALELEAAQLRDAIGSQRERVALARNVANRYERVRALGFVSEDQAVATRASLLEQGGALASLEREASNVARQRADVDGRLATVGARYDNEIAELERSVVETDAQIAENEARRAVAIAAPDDGVVTGIGRSVGEPVDTGVPLAVLVPLGSELEAELYAPSRAAGFLAEGQSVLLRYDAYPYQKFGHHAGRVIAISRTALASPDLRALGTSEPMYRVTATLVRQTIATYGEPRALRPGMAVEADVLLETRRIYEWVLEPLYSLVGRT